MSENKKIISGIIGIWVWVVVGITLIGFFGTIHLSINGNDTWDPPNWFTLIIEIGIGIGIATSILSYERFQQRKSDLQQKEISRLIDEVKKIEEEQQKFLDKQKFSVEEKQKFVASLLVWRLDGLNKLCIHINTNYERYLDAEEESKKIFFKRIIINRFDTKSKNFNINMSNLEIIELFGRQISNMYNMLMIDAESTSELYDLDDSKLYDGFSDADKELFGLDKNLQDLIEDVKVIQNQCMELRSLLEPYLDE